MMKLNFRVIFIINVAKQSEIAALVLNGQLTHTATSSAVIVYIWVNIARIRFMHFLCKICHLYGLCKIKSNGEYFVICVLN